MQDARQCATESLRELFTTGDEEEGVCVCVSVSVSVCVCVSVCARPARRVGHGPPNHLVNIVQFCNHT